MKLLLPKQIMDRLMEECKSVNTTPQAIRITSYNVCYTKLLREMDCGAETYEGAIELLFNMIYDKYGDYEHEF